MICASDNGDEKTYYYTEKYGKERNLKCRKQTVCEILPLIVVNEFLVKSYFIAFHVFMSGILASGLELSVVRELRQSGYAMVLRVF